MPRDDYFVIVYRILKYLYGRFQEGEAPNPDKFNAEAFDVAPGYWANILESMNDDGYVKNLVLIPRVGGAPGIRTDNLKITSFGIRYLEYDEDMQKAKELLKKS